MIDIGNGMRHLILPSFYRVYSVAGGYLVLKNSVKAFSRPAGSIYSVDGVYLVLKNSVKAFSRPAGSVYSVDSVYLVLRNSVKSFSHPAGSETGHRRLPSFT